MKLKILHIVESLEMGGLEKLVVDLTQWQVDNGYQVDVLSLSNNNQLFDIYLKKLPINFFSFPKQASLDLKLIRNIILLINKNKYDIVHTHNAMANYYSFFYKFLPNRKSYLINTRHGMGNIELNLKKEKIYKLSTIFTEKIIFVTSMALNLFVRQKLVKESKAKVVINGILPQANIKRKITKKELFPDLSNNPFIIGTVARLNSVKNQKYLFEIFKELKNKCVNKDLRLLIVGDGPERKYLERFVQSNSLTQSVYFTGMQDSVSEYLDIMDCFILTSKSEGIPLTILEAMEFGKIIFSTPVGGIVEVINDKKNGIFIPLDNKIKATALIQETINNRQLSEQLKKNARNSFKTKYTMEIMASKYEQTYLSVLGRI